MSSIFDNGLSGLKVSQQALNTTSNNIANINTPGFTRQEAVVTSRSSGSGGLAAGTGAQLADIRRIANDFANASLRRSTSDSGYASKLEELVGRSENIVGSDSLSIAKGLDGFFASLNSATETPQSTATRQQIISESKAIASRFNQIGSSLSLQDQQITNEVQSTLSVANGLTANIAKLNKSIAQAEANGSNTSSLQDQREELIKDLADKVDVRVTESSDGRISISLPKGQPLVLGSQSATLEYAGGNLDLTYNGQVFSVDSPGGAVGAMVDYQSGALADMKDDLDTQAANFADGINNQLAAGFDLNGNPGAPLFTYSAAGEAETLQVSSTIQPDELAFRGDDGTGAPLGGPGDNTNLKAIIDLKEPFYVAFNGTLGQLGIQSSQVQAEASASRNLLDDAQFRRDSISSVNQDEEAANLIKYTQAYQANAKVISTADRIFNELLGALR